MWCQWEGRDICLVYNKLNVGIVHHGHWEESSSLSCCSMTTTLRSFQMGSLSGMPKYSLHYQDQSFFFLHSNRLIKKPLCRALSCRSVLPWGIFFSACSPQDFDYFKPQSFPVILYLIFSLNFSPNCSSLDCPFLSPNTDDMFWTSTSLPLKTSFFCPDIFPKDKFPMPCIFMGKCSEMALPAGC